MSWFLKSRKKSQLNIGKQHTNEVKFQRFYIVKLSRRLSMPVSVRHKRFQGGFLDENGTKVSLRVAVTSLVLKCF